MLETARDRSVVSRWMRTLVVRLRAAWASARVGELLDGVAEGDGASDARTGGGRLAHFARHVRIRAAGLANHRYVTSSFVFRWLTAEPDPDLIEIDLAETVTLGLPIAILDRLVGRGGPPLDAAYRGSTLRDVLAIVRDRPLHILGIGIVSVTAASLAVDLVGGRPGVVGLATHVVLLLAGLAALRSTASWDELRQSRVGRWLAAILVPPEEPSTDRSGSESDPGDESEPGSRSVDDA